MNISQRLRACAKHTGLDAVIELLQEAADEIDALQARAQVQGEAEVVQQAAERYRWLRDLDHWPAPFLSSQEPEPVRGRDLDAAIDAAMLAAK